MKWVKFEKVGARVGDEVRGWNGYDWHIVELTAFDLGMGSISAGLHNERISLQDCEVMIDDGWNDDEDIAVIDLVEEASDITAFMALAELHKVDDNKFNGADEAAVETFVNEVNDAVETFKYELSKRLAKVMDELHDRGVFE